MRNGEAIKLAEVPVLGFSEFYERVIEQLRRGVWRITAWFVDDSMMYMILANDTKGTLQVLATRPERSWISICSEFPQAGVFEREIAEQGKIVVEGNPWLKPVRVLQKEKSFFHIVGMEINEVGVGPVLGEVTQPLYYRFQCHGEEVLNLEISLGYQHRGVEKLLIGGPNPRSIHYMETVSGDATIGHATAYCMAMEALAGVPASKDALKVRALALELERLAHHTGDLGDLCATVNFALTSAYCRRIAEEYMGMTAMICGNSYGRGLVRPGGIGYRVDSEIMGRMRYWLEEVYCDTVEALALMLNSTSVMGRFERCGSLPLGIARQLGTVGLVARASGMPRDVRVHFPFGDIPNYGVVLGKNGDVYDRAKVRWREIKNSGKIVSRLCETIGEVKPVAEPLRPRPSSLAVSMVEGWRGEICHVALTDEHGKFKFYKVIDPSFHNFLGLAYLMRGAQISDFPLCSRSFSLSCSGHDL